MLASNLEYLHHEVRAATIAATTPLMYATQAVSPKMKMAIVMEPLRQMLIPCNTIPSVSKLPAAACRVYSQRVC